MNLNELSALAHSIAKEKGFWDTERRTSEVLMLIVTEVAEACQADRKGDYPKFKEEIADVFIRLFDLCGSLEIDIEKEIKSKMEINKSRPRLHNRKY